MWCLRHLGVNKRYLPSFFNIVLHWWLEGTEYLLAEFFDGELRPEEREMEWVA